MPDENTDAQAQIAEIRERIDEIDCQLVQAAQRARAVLARHPRTQAAGALGALRPQARRGDLRERRQVQRGPALRRRPARDLRGHPARREGDEGLMAAAERAGDRRRHARRRHDDHRRPVLGREPRADARGRRVPLKELGIKVMRGGAYKPRTSPFSFQGLEEEGLEDHARGRRRVRSARRHRGHRLGARRDGRRLRRHAPDRHAQHGQLQPAEEDRRGHRRERQAGRVQARHGRRRSRSGCRRATTSR